MVKRPDRAAGKRGCGLGEILPVRTPGRISISHAGRLSATMRLSLPTGRKTQRPPFDLFRVRRGVGWGGGGVWGVKARGQDPQRRASGPGSFCCCRPPPTQGALGQGQRGIRWTMRSVVGGRNTRTRKRRTTEKRGRSEGWRGRGGCVLENTDQNTHTHGLDDQRWTAVICCSFVVTNFNCVTQQR